MIFRGAEAVVEKIKWHDFTAVSKMRTNVHTGIQN